MQENKEHSRKNKSTGPLGKLLAAVLIVLLLAGAGVLIVKNTPTNRQMPKEDYFGERQEDEAALILGGEIRKERAIEKDGALYLPYNIVKDSLNPRFYWDADIAKMLFTTAEQEFEIPVNSASYSVIDGVTTDDPVSEGSYEKIIVLRPDDERITGDNSTGLYVNADFLAGYTQVACSWQKDESRKTAGHVVITNFVENPMEVLKAEARKEAAVRYEAGIKSPILTTLEKGEDAEVLEQLGKWQKVLTEDGFIGYVKTNRMSEAYTDETFATQKAVEYPSITMDEPVNLVWHQIADENGNDYLTDAIKNMTGVNVISPTWFSLEDNDGNIKSVGSKKYVKQAKKKGLQVWGLVSDFSSEMDTSAVLASTSARRNCIGQLVKEAENLGLDGINLDFEYMEEADAAAYVQFVRELSIECRRSSLVFSVDIKPPYDFNKWMNRKEIATVADYLINMGYDEHYVGSEAGSVASLSYEENAVKETLAQGVPAEKLVSAIPFYTRIWYTSEDSDGTVSTNSEVLSMGGAEQTLESWHVTPKWDMDAFQHLADWKTDDGVRCRIWMEDEDSISAKARLVPRYGLAGIAVWKLGFEDSGIWDVVSDNISLDQEAAEEAQKKAESEHAAEPQVPDETEASGSAGSTETET